MKKFMLISLVTAVCFIIAGISALNVNQEQVRHILTSSEKSSISTPAEKTYAIKDIHTLSLGFPNADLEFIPTDELKDTMVMSYQEHYSKDKNKELFYPLIEDNINNGQLSIEFKQRDEKSGGNNFNVTKTNKFPYFKFVLNIQDSNIKIKVPKSFELKSLNIGIANGEIEIPQLQLQNLNIELVNGDVSIEDISAEQISVEVVNGDIEMKSTKFNNLAIETVTGDVDLEDVSLNADYRIETVTGDVSVSASDALTGNLKISSTTGDIEIDGVNHKRNVEITSKDNTSQINLEVVTGDILIKTKTKL